MEVEGLEPERFSFTQIWQAYKVPILLGGASLLFILISIFILIKSYQSAVPIEFSRSSDEASASGQDSFIIVDVGGAVVRPGVYKVPYGSRVEDAIAAAGGLSTEADSESIGKSVNRAAKLSDGAKLWIPKKSIQKGSGLTEDQGLTPVLQAGQVAGSVSTQVSINASSQSELEELSGIGSVTAQKIIGGRPYMSLEELVTKKAMGQSLFNKLREQLTL